MKLVVVILDLEIARARGVDGRELYSRGLGKFLKGYRARNNSKNERLQKRILFVFEGVIHKPQRE